MPIIENSFKSDNLVTERLILRPLKMSDASRIKELAGNYNVSKTTRSIPYPYEDGMAELWIKSTHEMADTGESLAWAIQRASDNILIGSIGLVDITSSEAVLGFWVGENYWGLGYCSEATRSVLAFAFKFMKLKKITAEHLTYNIASGKVMKKSGMSHVGTTRKECRVGEVSDIEIYEIVYTNFF